MKITNVTKLPEFLRNLNKDVKELDGVVKNLNYLVQESVKTIDGIKKDHSELELAAEQNRKELDRMRLRNTELEHMVRVSKMKTSSSPRSDAAETTAKPVLFAENHDLDAFYLEFENYFRGTEEEIHKKQQPYIELMKKAKVSKKLPIVDLGCGRGEFLDLLNQNGFSPLGVDLNESMVERAKSQGFKAEKNDAISFLLTQKSGSLAGITGFHLAEHIPFDQLLLLISEAYRCLTEGGLLILETPNPESLFVGAFTFHYDPSHLKPIPPAIMQFSAQFKGFEKADILRLQPELTPKEIAQATKNATLQGALQRLYGPRDYALVAQK